MGKETITIINTIDVDTLKNAVDGIAKAVDSLPSALGLGRLESIVKAVDSLGIIVDNYACGWDFGLSAFLQIVTIVVLVLTIVATNYFHYRSDKVLRDIQRQDVNLKLFDRRIETRDRLLDWRDLIKEITIKKPHNDEIIVMFREGLLVNMRDPALQDYSAQMDEYTRLIRAEEKTEQKEVIKTKQGWLFYKKWCYIVGDARRHVSIIENYFNFTNEITGTLKTFGQKCLDLVTKYADIETGKTNLNTDVSSDMNSLFKELSNATKELFDDTAFIEAMDSQIDELRKSLSLNVTKKGTV